MWKCPACETLNNNDKCVICGEPKPADGGKAPPVVGAGVSVPPLSEPRKIPAYSPEMARTSTYYEDGLDPTPKLEYKPKESSESTNWGLIIMLVVLGIITLLIIVGATKTYATDAGLNTAYNGELTEQYTAVNTSDLLIE